MHAHPSPNSAGAHLFESTMRDAEETILLAPAPSPAPAPFAALSYTPFATAMPSLAAFGGLAPIITGAIPAPSSYISPIYDPGCHTPVGGWSLEGPVGPGGPPIMTPRTMGVWEEAKGEEEEPPSRPPSIAKAFVQRSKAQQWHTQEPNRKHSWRARYRQRVQERHLQAEAQQSPAQEPGHPRQHSSKGQGGRGGRGGRGRGH